MITGTNKHGDKVKINTRSRDGRVLITVSVIYSNGMGYAETAGSIDEAKAKCEQILGAIAWDSVKYP